MDEKFGPRLFLINYGLKNKKMSKTVFPHNLQKTTQFLTLAAPLQEKMTYSNTFDNTLQEKQDVI